jgi:hypothetical protein
MQPLARFQALVIGVGTYDHFDDLPETVNDATQLKQALIDKRRCGYPPDRVQLLVESGATRKNILNGLARLADNAAGDTTTVVYFSGHGGQLRDDTAATYLLPREADFADLAGTALSNDVLSQALAQINSRRLVVMLDACHASGAASFKGAKSADDAADAAKGFTLTGAIGQQFARYQLRAGSGRVIFASSRSEQLSWTYPTGHMSLFTYYLIQGLQGHAPASDDGTIRVFDLFHYISKQVQAKKHDQQPLLAARDVSQNFPIALSYGGRKESTDVTSVSQQEDLALYRDAITQDASAGVRAFAIYLRNIPVELLEAAGAEPAVIDLKLAVFIDFDKRIRTLGHHASWEASRNEAILFFITLCIDLQRVLSV